MYMLYVQIVRYVKDVEYVQYVQHVQIVRLVHYVHEVCTYVRVCVRSTKHTKNKYIYILNIDRYCGLITNTATQKDLLLFSKKCLHQARSTVNRAWGYQFV